MTLAGILAVLLLTPHLPYSDHEQTEHILVTRDTPFGGTITTERDASTALREGEAALKAARYVLRLPDVRFVIVDARHEGAEWGEVSPDGAVIYPWIFGSGAGDRKPRAPDYVLRHEIGHDLFIRYLVPNTRGGQYGGDAPDWLDEMAAVAFEEVEQQVARRRLVRLYLRTGELMPMQTFLAMTHPELSSELPDMAAGDLYRVRPMTSQNTPQFYAMARALYDFLVARTGASSIIAELADAFRSGEPLNDWILYRTGHNATGGVQSLNDDFLAWIASDPRYSDKALGQN